MADMLGKVLLWKLVVCGAERVVEASAAGDQAVVEQMEQIFRNTLLPLVGMPADGAKAHAGNAYADLSPLELGALTEYEKRFLRATEENPDVPTRDLRREAKVDALRFPNVRDELVAKGLVAVEQMRSGQGLRKVCRLTPAGEEALRNLSKENGAAPA